MQVWDFSYPADSTASVFSVVGPQDLKEDVGVGAVVIKLQQAGETAHTSLKNTAFINGFSFSYGFLNIKQKHQTQWILLNCVWCAKSYEFIT